MSIDIMSNSYLRLLSWFLYILETVLLISLQAICKIWKKNCKSMDWLLLKFVCQRSSSILCYMLMFMPCSCSYTDEE